MTDPVGEGEKCAKCGWPIRWVWRHVWSRQSPVTLIYRRGYWRHQRGRYGLKRHKATPI